MTILIREYNLYYVYTYSDSGWYGYKKSHLKYSEIGEKLNWPGKNNKITNYSKENIRKFRINKSRCFF